MFRKVIRKEIEKVVPEGTKFVVEIPENLEHGDYASNVAMILAKKEGKNPKEVAEEIKSKLQIKIIERIDIANAGFLNFFISSKALTPPLKGIFKKNNSHELFFDFFRKLFSKKKTVIVEYFQLNIAKRPHIGHMRSAIIGDALKRMFLEAGYNAISDTHVGDWGTQFGILLLEYKILKPNMRSEIFSSGDLFEKLENMYISGNESIAREASRLELAKEEFAKLERGDPENKKLWQDMVNISMKKLKENADFLWLLPFDENKSESSYENDMPAIVEEALQKRVASKKDDGAVIVDLTNEKLDDAVLMKSDGASTYLLRDLATIKYRKSKHKFWKNLYVVDVRQDHHFKQVFKVAEKLSWGDPGEHVSYGFIKLPEGTMSTRVRGSTISIEKVIEEAQNRAKKIIEEKNPELKNKEEVARKVGLGALKYFDLSHNRKSDIEFLWEDALSFEGNTGPYLQYTYARLRSILRKYGKNPIWNLGAKANMDTREKQLFLAVSQFDESLEDAITDYLPNILSNYLYGLAQKANEFYHSHPVLQESDEQKKQLRLVLISAVAETLKKGLYLLGIDAPEEM